MKTLIRVTTLLFVDMWMMIQSLPGIDEIDREEVRLHVERNFSAQVMAENYIRVYKNVMRNIS